MSAAISPVKPSDLPDAEQAAVNLAALTVPTRDEILAACERRIAAIEATSPLRELVYVDEITFPIDALIATNPHWTKVHDGVVDHGALASLMRAEYEAIRGLPAPTVYFLNPAYVAPWFRAIEAQKRHAEHRRVMLWKYRKLRGMPLPA